MMTKGYFSSVVMTRVTLSVLTILFSAEPKVSSLRRNALRGAINRLPAVTVRPDRLFAVIRARQGTRRRMITFMARNRSK